MSQSSVEMLSPCTRLEPLQILEIGRLRLTISILCDALQIHGASMGKDGGLSRACPKQ